MSLNFTRAPPLNIPCYPVPQLKVILPISVPQFPPSPLSLGWHSHSLPEGWESIRHERFSFLLFGCRIYLFLSHELPPFPQFQKLRHVSFSVRFSIFTSTLTLTSSYHVHGHLFYCQVISYIFRSCYSTFFLTHSYPHYMSIVNGTVIYNNYRYPTGTQLEIIATTTASELIERGVGCKSGFFKVVPDILICQSPGTTDLYNFLARA